MFKEGMLENYMLLDFILLVYYVLKTVVWIENCYSKRLSVEERKFLLLKRQDIVNIILLSIM